jgi:hypothetical protein
MEVPSCSVITGRRDVVGAGWRLFITLSAEDKFVHARMKASGTVVGLKASSKTKRKYRTYDTWRWRNSASAERWKRRFMVLGGTYVMQINFRKSGLESTCSFGRRSKSTPGQRLRCAHASTLMPAAVATRRQLVDSRRTCVLGL